MHQRDWQDDYKSATTHYTINTAAQDYQKSQLTALDKTTRTLLHCSPFPAPTDIPNPNLDCRYTTTMPKVRHGALNISLHNDIDYRFGSASYRLFKAFEVSYPKPDARYSTILTPAWLR